MLSLIDGDIVAFRAGFSCESKDPTTGEKGVLPVEIAYARCNDMMENILRETGAENHRVFLTDSIGNFRKKVSAEYKANRKDVARPVHLHDLEAFLIQEWGAVRAVEEEADDMLGIAQTTAWNNEIESVICSIDKDLHQIAGKHYNFVKEEFSEVTEEEGLFFFYKQLLMGDSVDNIMGVPGIGPKKAEKYLAPYMGDESALYRECLAHYTAAFPNMCIEEIEEAMITTGRLVWIRREKEQLWTPPQFM